MTHVNHNSTDQSTDTKFSCSVTLGGSSTMLSGSVGGCSRWIPNLFNVDQVAEATWCLSGTCRCLAVSPVEISGVHPGLQGASDWIGSSLDVSFKKLPVQLSNSVHGHLEDRRPMEEKTKNKKKNKQTNTVKYKVIINITSPLFLR